MNYEGDRWRREGGGVKEENGEVKSNLFPSISVTAVINLYTPWLELCDGGWDVFLFKSLWNVNRNSTNRFTRIHYRLNHCGRSGDVLDVSQLQSWAAGKEFHFSLCKENAVKMPSFLFVFFMIFPVFAPFFDTVWTILGQNNDQ